ncbi:PRKR-interacting protein 1 homolog [Daktulosphaira vitifoliae]|uniref:PRKR-interacting protein 1 homolog n=1 Tax=Daktulosphaira vitifoliae TaxID=58002 RepID=UPI0021A9E2AD|nr:PRKR-interacting protein 1 homolog [Daktulosphaira vitifoliae]
MIDDGKEDEDSKPTIVKNIIKNATDLQRLKLERLMKNPDKPVYIPEPRSEKKTPHVPDFVRNVMGSSAGAGSGEFHVYRHLRRKEYARQKHIQLKAEKELLEEAYKQKILENKQMAEERTAKKRAKRLKRKQVLKLKAKKSKNMKTDSDSSNDSENQDNSET